MSFGVTKIERDGPLSVMEFHDAATWRGCDLFVGYSDERGCHLRSADANAQNRSDGAIETRAWSRARGSI
jgi:hypothetical protein